LQIQEQLYENDLIDALRPYLKSEKVFMESDDARLTPVRLDMLKALARKWKLNTRADFWRDIGSSKLKLCVALTQHLMHRLEDDQRRGASAGGIGSTRGLLVAAAASSTAGSSAITADGGTAPLASSRLSIAHGAETGATPSVSGLRAAKAMRKVLPHYGGARRCCRMELFRHHFE